MNELKGDQSNCSERPRPMAVIVLLVYFPFKGSRHWLFGREYGCDHSCLIVWTVRSVSSFLLFSLLCHKHELCALNELKPRVILIDRCNCVHFPLHHEILFLFTHLYYYNTEHSLSLFPINPIPTTASTHFALFFFIQVNTPTSGITNHNKNKTYPPSRAHRSSRCI